MSNLPAKVLVYGILGLSFYISIITYWNTDKIESISKCLPNEYVRLERYQADQTTTLFYLHRIEDKLDLLLK